MSSDDRPQLAGRPIFAVTRSKRARTAANETTTETSEDRPSSVVHVRRRAQAPSATSEEVGKLVHVALNTWWTADPAQRYWMEITHREDIGGNLHAPSSTALAACRRPRRGCITQEVGLACLVSSDPLVYAALLVVSAGARVPKASRIDGIAALDTVGAARTIPGRGSDSKSEVMLERRCSWRPTWRNFDAS